ncbi:MAG TPA: gliding motility-associated C-terminal domain-containing protein, partial [Flavobacteriales bacterium]|nr:gliding motility-associated C-terminal domain-containing protein [Flavobacteriales bacterium]
CITNQNTLASGNDFALDDISFTPFCNYTDSVTVTVHPYPEPDLGPNQTICGEGTVLLDATTTDVDSYIWNDGLANGPTLSVSTSGTYWVNVLDGACFGRDSVDVTFVSLPVINLGGDRVVCTGDSVVLSAGGGNFNYTWQDGSSGNTWTGAESTLAWVTVLQGPCIASDTVRITITTCDVVVEVPNVFTPNGDPHNGAFKPIRVDGVNGLDLHVYSRWGTKVYASKQINFTWDGRAENGEPVPDGVYYWTIEYNGAKGPGEKHGIVTLLR